jgi:hypothetical protein
MIVLVAFNFGAKPEEMDMMRWITGLNGSFLRR